MGLAGGREVLGHADVQLRARRRRTRRRRRAAAPRASRARGARAGGRRSRAPRARTRRRGDLHVVESVDPMPGVIKRKATRREPLEEPSDRSAEASRSSGRRAFRPQASLSAAATFASGENLENRFSERKGMPIRIPHPAKKIPALSRGARLQSTMERTEPQNPWLPPGAPAAPPPPYEEPRKSLGQRLLGPIVAARRAAGQVRQGRAAAADEGEVPDDVALDARLDRRLLADLGLAVRGRVRGAAVRARDGPLHPDAPRGRAAELDGVHPVPRRRGRRPLARRLGARRGARRPRRPGARHHRHARRRWHLPR